MNKSITDMILHLHAHKFKGVFEIEISTIDFCVS